MSSYDQGKTDSLYSPKSVIIVVLVVGGKFLAIDMLCGSSVVPMFISSSSITATGPSKFCYPVFTWFLVLTRNLDWGCVGFRCFSDVDLE